MVTLSSAEQALKTVYLGVVSEQLNKVTNPLLAKIKQSSDDVWGKEIRKVAQFGINGGIGAGTETGELPTPGENKYVTLRLDLKNLYGTIEISDKALRASQSSAGAFVNLLNAEMEGLLKASSFNFSRMLYGDGTGKLATVTAVSGSLITVDSTRCLMEGMIVDFTNDEDGINVAASGARIQQIDRIAKTISFNKTITGVAIGDFMLIQRSEDNELTGLEAIFKQDGSLYGVNRLSNKWFAANVQNNVGAISDLTIQSVIDRMEERANSNIDFIVCSYGVRRAYQEYLSTFKKNIDILNLEGGYKAISYNGVPIVAERFVPEGTMYLLNTKDFMLHQLCDWSWLEGDDGRVIKQIANRPAYTATLVKYADLICHRPYAQVKLTGITEK